MDKETLINIILKDLGEIETMVRSFQGQKNIPSAFIDLTESKLTHLSQELSLLKEINIGTSSAQTEDLPEASDSNPVVSEKQPETIEEKIESQHKIEEPETPVVTEAPVVQEEVMEEAPVVEKIKEPEIHQVEPANVEEVLIQSEPIVKPETKETKDNNKTLGESLIAEKKSVNDKMANTQVSNLKKTLKGKPVADLSKGLGINDRFMFQRELFEGRNELMNQTLQQLNDMPDYNSACSFIQSNFTWDEEAEATKAFYNYIERKF